MNLSKFTRRLEECRKRWHRRTVQYVLEVVRIVRAARKAAKDERRWGKWIRNETHMNRITVYRYLAVAKFLRTNVYLKQQLVSLSIAKLYALSRLTSEQVTHLLRSGKAVRLNDVAFLQLVRRLAPKAVVRETLPNLSKSLNAALDRLDRSLRRWHLSALMMPAAMQSKTQARLDAMSRTLERLRRASAAAM